MVKIEKGIPLPKDNWAWISKLEVGDSVLLKDPAISTKTNVYRHAAECGIKVTVRTVEGGARVWRVK